MFCCPGVAPKQNVAPTLPQKEQMAKEKKRLTEPAIQKFRPAAEGKRDHYWDALVPGFGVRVTDKGAKSYIVMYRVKGGSKNPIRHTFGPAGKGGLKLADVREAAREIIMAARRGIDLPAERRAAAVVAGDISINAIAERFKAEYVATVHKNAHRTGLIIDGYIVPKWKGRTIDTIRRTDVRALVLDVRDKNGLYMANRVLAVARKMLNWCEDEEIILEAPSFRGVAIKGEKKRERTLRDEELRLLWLAANRVGEPFGPFVQFLMLTGARLDTEVARMKWDEVDGDLWTVPGERMKSGRQHQVPLSSLAIDVLEAILRVKGQEHVFCSGRKGDVPISGFSKAKKRIDGMMLKIKQEEAQAVGVDTNTPESIEPWRYHDIRRTVATGMAELRVPRVTISRVLDHAEGGVTSIYDRHSYLSEKREALETWASKIARIRVRH
jgi:integrase